MINVRWNDEVKVFDYIQDAGDYVYYRTDCKNIDLITDEGTRHYDDVSRYDLVGDFGLSYYDLFDEEPDYDDVEDTNA